MRITLAEDLSERRFIPTSCGNDNFNSLIAFTACLAVGE